MEGKNLEVTHYNDGTTIPYVSSNGAWEELMEPGYCWYNNEIINKETYGGMYNWYAVDVGNLCPVGWHVPSEDEWNTLSTFLGGETEAGVKLKESGTNHWVPTNTYATNESGFTALPGGWRVITLGNFFAIGSSAHFWSSTEIDPIIGTANSRIYNIIILTYLVVTTVRE